MAEEFTIKSTSLEDKIKELLPSQANFGAGQDLSASSMIIPIVDLTESAEGSSLRVDLQSALSHDSTTTFSITNATNTVITNTTGYWRVFGSMGIANANSSAIFSEINVYDGSTSKLLLKNNNSINNDTNGIITFDFICKLSAGDSLRGTANDGQQSLKGVVRQLADINGTLVNP